LEERIASIFRVDNKRSKLLPDYTAMSTLIADFLFGSFINPEVRGDMFRENVG
jgi:hypothetical protein